MKEIDKIIKELKETWDLTTEQLNDIKSYILAYALGAAHDSSIFKEAMEEEVEHEKYMDGV